LNQFAEHIIASWALDTLSKLKSNYVLQFFDSQIQTVVSVIIQSSQSKNLNLEPVVQTNIFSLKNQVRDRDQRQILCQNMIRISFVCHSEVFWLKIMTNPSKFSSDSWSQYDNQFGITNIEKKAQKLLWKYDKEIFCSVALKRSIIRHILIRPFKFHLK
jgi:hypothetical protein